MTGVAELTRYVLRNNRRSWKVFLHSILRYLKQILTGRKMPKQRFVLLCWRRTGSNWLCGILHNHPEIFMHNELFNETSIHTYYPELVKKWTYHSRDLMPDKFLLEMYESYKRLPESQNKLIKAVGFKSFPEHYWDIGKPNPVLEETFKDIMLDADIKKVILYRENLFAVYISMVRSKETGAYLTKNYDDVKVHINIPELQKFVDRYLYNYRLYEELSRGQSILKLSYEALCTDQHTVIMKKLFNYLGVSTQVSPTALVETVPQSNGDIRASIANYAEVEFAFRHSLQAKYLPPSLHVTSNITECTISEDERTVPWEYSHLSPNSTAESIRGKLTHLNTVLTTASTTNSTTRTTNGNDNVFYTWSILIPITSHSLSYDECKHRLITMIQCIISTSTPQELQHISLIFGIDEDDPIYNDELGLTLLHDVCTFTTIAATTNSNTTSSIDTSTNIAFDSTHNLRKHVISYTIKTLPVLLKGKLCKIWNVLSRTAYSMGSEFQLLLGDDVHLLTPQWKSKIEASFLQIAERQQVPYGFGCVAFHDHSFPGFATFPVIHRLHLDIFHRLLPPQFINQGGDPYLYTLYKRFDCACFSSGCELVNTIGGKDADTRYLKQHIRWNNEILTASIRQLEELTSRRAMKCIDVVVPTYRCDINILKQIVSIRATVPILVNFWLIVDNPAHPNLDAVRELERVSDNYSVNIREHKHNFGASAARNTGLDYSDADYVLFLDDDVTPSVHILDAYIGGILRYPEATVLVGSTHLPAPHTLITHAFVASDLIGSYTIAEKRSDPAWGVTANLCVKGRTSRIRFDLSYPKTGGGEDIDYCVKMTRTSTGSIVSIPGALAYHPWWCNGSIRSIYHILGWARGESLCVGSKYLRQHVYFTAPNGIELCMLLICMSLVFYVIGIHFSSTLMLCSIVIIFILETAWHSSHVYHRMADNMKTSLVSHITITICAAWVVMLQEAARCVAHINRGALYNICWRFDWVCGKNPGYIRKTKINLFVKCLVYMCITLILQWYLPPDTTCSM